jgi:hypothetical protein
VNLGHLASPTLAMEFGHLPIGHGIGLVNITTCVRDATVPRFNPPAEPARTVGFGNQAASARERDLTVRERDWVWDRRRLGRNCKQPCEEGIGSRQVFSVGKIRVS